MKKSLHIIILAVFQLLVFVGPIIIKSTHHHLYPYYASAKDVNGYSKVQKPCFICQFEFVPSIIQIQDPRVILKPETSVINSVIIAQVKDCTFSYLSLRAPPII